MHAAIYEASPQKKVVSFPLQENVRMDSRSQSVPSLLQLPDCCLAVLQCCDDDDTLFSAARSHSRLHQAAVLVASSIEVVVTEQQQLDSVLLYLANHGQHVDSIDLARGDGGWYTLRQLPLDKLQELSTLVCTGLDLQLQPGGGFEGVLGAGMPLEQLQLDNCELLDGVEGLKGLSALTGLQYLAIGLHDDFIMHGFPTNVLRGMRQLTHLELVSLWLDDSADLKHLQGLTRLQHLKLKCDSDLTMDTNMLSGLQLLTRFQLCGGYEGDEENGEDGMRTLFDAAGLSGKTKLRHLELVSCRMQGGAAGVAELLSSLQHMHRLTNLSIQCSLEAIPAAAYSALTASSKLRELKLKGSILPAGVWRHVFPVNRRLPHLRELDVGYVRTPSDPAHAPDGSRLASCCPGLRSLHMRGLYYGEGQVARLTGLSSLRQLWLNPPDGSCEALEEVCQLTGLSWLFLSGFEDPLEMLLELTQLRQLTHLHYSGDTHEEYFECNAKARGDEPVWRQALRHLLNHKDANVANQAARDLQECGSH